MTDTAPSFTAVVYVHGIGQQSRYEELSRLIQSFEDYADAQETLTFGTFETKIEPSHAPQREKNVGYVALNQEDRHYHFYEVYWAPLTATGTTGWNVGAWLLRHMLTPLHILHSSWHTRQRLRRSYLYMWWERNHDENANFAPLKQLIAHYNAFCETAIHSADKYGNFKDFLAYLEAKKASDLIPLARQWRRFLRRIEVSNFFILLTIIYMTLLVPILTIARIVQLGFENVSIASFFLNSPASMAILYVVLGLLLVIVLPIVSHFLRVYIGDVQLWATYEETDEKNKKHEAILQRSIEMMTHVLNHPNCERVVLITHSLGTTIAYDTLLSIGRHNRALKTKQTRVETPQKILESNAQKLRVPQAAFFPVEGRTAGAPTAIELGGFSEEHIPAHKIEYFVTMGSPIDKIHYFFESRRGMYRPYETIVDGIRGDIGCGPFADDDNKPNFRWVNFWQPDDVISGALTTPNPREVERADLRVENVRVESYLFPSPGRSHVGYFTHDAVVRVLYRMVFRHGKVQPTDDLRRMLKQRIVLPSQWVRNLLLAGAWTLLFAMFFDVYNISWLQNIFTTAFLSTLTVIGALIVVSVSWGKLHPFKWDDSSEDNTKASQ